MGILQILEKLRAQADALDAIGKTKEADQIDALIFKISNLNEFISEYTTIIIKEAVIKTEKKDGKTYYTVRSPSNPKWKGGTYSSRKAAEKRLKEIEMFKHMKKKNKSDK